MTHTRRTFLASAATPLLRSQELAADPDRPQFHFLPPRAWMNDPNAPALINGVYHLYYQHNPKAAEWDTMNWGHATSQDLVHWRHNAIALSPTKDGPDKDGCWSGCMVMDRATPTILYTGVNPQVQILATSEDLQNWTKRSRPVLSAPPPGIDSPGFRDPHVWREGDEWLMLVGAGFRGVGGTALLYRADNLTEWTYLRPLLSGKMDPNVRGDVASGEMWECPDFFPVLDQWVFYVATQDKVLYWIGGWENRTFTPVQSGTLFHGAGYAPKSFQANARRLIWTWLREQRSKEDQLRAGWSGVMSLAAVPTIDRAGKLQIAPAREYRALRKTRLTRDTLAEDCFEIRVEAGARKPFLLTRGGKPLVQWKDGVLSSGSSRAPLPVDDALLHIFVDGSVIEVFTEQSVTLAGRVYGTSGKVALEGATGGFEGWALSPISKNRLTS